jgi:NADPH-dependent curcumin reductase CurA
VTSAPTTARVVTLVARPAAAPGPEHFSLSTTRIPKLCAGQLLVRNVYMSVDPAMRGRMEQTEKHYTTNFAVGDPLDGSAVGEVVQSAAPGIDVGSHVRHRLGWRDFAVVDAAAATVVDCSVAPLADWLGILGQTGFTAYVGLTRAGNLAAGDTVFVSAAAGAVGSAAGQFAPLLGAGRVIGSAGGPEKARLLVDKLGFHAGIDYREDLPRSLAEAAPDGIDLYFDNVGGDHLVAALYALRERGRVALCGMISDLQDRGRSPAIGHLIQATLKRLTIQGFIVRDHEDLRGEFERQVSGWLRDGSVTSRQTVTAGLENAPDAFSSMLRGGNVGKALVQVSDERS